MPDEGRPGSLVHRLNATTRILAVEDDDDIAEFLRAYFRASGYDLVRIDPRSPKEVVEAVDANEPDLILLDYRLRGFSGHDAYRLLRSQDRFAFLPVIVVTADETAPAQTAATASGLDGFVTKPFNVNLLKELVGERIESARAMAASGRDEALGVMTQQYLMARLHDEVATAGQGHPMSFAIVRLRNLADLRRDVGDDGLQFVVRRMITTARDLLPDEAVLARTDTDELAVILPGVPVGDAEPELERMLEDAAGTIELPGGAEVSVSISAGLAGCPQQATSSDELYMAADAALDAVDGEHLLRTAL